MSDSVIRNIHQHNLVSFQSLLEICKKLNDQYNPERPLIRIFNLNAVYNDAKAAYAKFVTAMDAFNNAFSERQKKFSDVRTFSEKIITQLAESGVQYDLLEQIKLRNAKVYAQTIVPRKTPFIDYGISGHDDALLRSVSEAQEMYVNQVDHLHQLLIEAAALPGYTPEETDLNTSAINAKTTRLKELNKVVSNTFYTLSHAKFILDTTFYIKQECLINLGIDVKQYLKRILAPEHAGLKASQKIDFIHEKKKPVSS